MEVLQFSEGKGEVVNGKDWGENGRRRGRDGKSNQAVKKLIHQLINKKQKLKKEKTMICFRNW